MRQRVARRAPCSDGEERVFRLEQAARDAVEAVEAAEFAQHHEKPPGDDLVGIGQGQPRQPAEQAHMEGLHRGCQPVLLGGIDVRQEEKFVPIDVETKDERELRHGKDENQGGWGEAPGR